MSNSSWTLDRDRLEQVPCPLCHGVSFERLATTDRHNMGLVTVGCKRCGLVMTNPQPTATALDDFYKNHYRRFYRDVGPPDAVPTLSHIAAKHIDKRTRVTVDDLVDRGALSGGMVVLDIGAAEGSMLKAVADRFPDTRRFAIEPNPVFGAFATTHAGCEWHPSLADFRATQPPPIDLVIINHVIEHLKDPVQVLASLKPLLSPRGRIYVEVPDVLAYRKLRALHIAHLYHFGPDTLARLAVQAGFDLPAIDAYAPAKHPRSLRCVLTPSAEAVSAPAPVNARAGWRAVSACARHAWFVHGKRWLRSFSAAR